MMRLILLLYSSFYLTDGFKDLYGGPMEVIEHGETILYDDLPIEKKVEFIQKWSANFSELVLKGEDFDVERATREKYDQFSSLIQHRHTGSIIDQFLFKYNNNNEIRDLLSQNKKDLDDNKPVMNRNLNTTLERFPDTCQWTCHRYVRYKKIILGELSNLYEEPKDTNSLHEIVVSLMVPMFSWNITEMSNRKVMEFKRTYDKEFSELEATAANYWSSLNNNFGEDYRKVLMRIFKRQVADLTEEGKKIIEDVKVFNKEYKKKVQQEIDAAIEAQETYKSLPINGKVGFLKMEFDSLMDEIRSANQSAQDKRRCILGQLEEIVHTQLELISLATLLGITRQNHENNARVIRLLTSKEEDLRREDTRRIKGEYSLNDPINLVGKTKTGGLLRIQTKIKDALINLLDESKDTETEKMIESNLAEVVSLNVTEVFRPVQEAFEIRRSTLEKDFFIIVMNLPCSYTKLNPEQVDQCLHSSNMLTDAGKKTLEEIKVIRKNYKEKLQSEIDAIDANNNKNAKILQQKKRKLGLDRKKRGGKP